MHFEFDFQAALNLMFFVALLWLIFGNNDDDDAETEEPYFASKSTTASGFSSQITASGPDADEVAALIDRLTEEVPKE